jgi:hypothetical protein
MSPRPIRIRLLTMVCMLACAVSGGLGWFVGLLSTYLYGSDLVEHDFVFAVPRYVGGWFGLCSSLVAAIVWCWVIVPLSLKNVMGLRSMAGLVGLGAGVLAAILLHAVMMFTEGMFRINALAVGLGMAAPAGLVLGFIGGHLCRMAVTTERVYRTGPVRRRPIRPHPPASEPDYMEQLDVRSSIRPRPEFRDEYDA